MKVKVAQSCLTLCDQMGYTVHGILQAKILQNTGVGSCSLLQGIFPTQGSNPGLPSYMSTIVENNLLHLIMKASLVAQIV